MAPSKGPKRQRAAAAPESDADAFKLRDTGEPARADKARVHILAPGIVCDTEPRGHATPRGRSPLEIVVDASEGFIPLWAEGSILHWRFRERSLAHFANPVAAKARIRRLFGEALIAWGAAAPVRFTEDEDVWDFEIVARASDECDASGCVLASAFFPDPGRHQLVLYPQLFAQNHAEQVETLIHEIGHVFGLRHFFADVSETAWPSEIFGTHTKFSIMNYGQLSMLTDDDRDDLRRLYTQAWRGTLTQINGTRIRLVRPFNTLAPGPSRLAGTGMPRVAAGTFAVARERPLQPRGAVRDTVTEVAAKTAVPVTVAASVGAGGRLSAKLNGERLIFHSGQANAVVQAGQTHKLDWIAVGPAGTNWSVKVTVPANTGCDSSGALDESRQAAGFCRFRS